MFVDVPLVGAVKMAIVHIIDMTLVFDCGVATPRTVRMGVLIVCFVVAHFKLPPCDPCG
jgi:hypothetical protein